MCFSNFSTYPPVVKHGNGEFPFTDDVPIKMPMQMGISQPFLVFDLLDDTLVVAIWACRSCLRLSSMPLRRAQFAQKTDRLQKSSGIRYPLSREHDELSIKRLSV